MPTATIQINSPVITPPAYFDVQYRSVPAGAWVALPPQSNAAFQIPGLATGDYELSIKVVDSDGVPCDELVRVFTVVDECACVEITGADVKADVPGGATYLNIYFTPPGTIYEVPQCGMRVDYGPIGGPVTTVWLYPTTFPAISPMQLPVTAAVAHHVKITGNCCGTQATCYDQDAPYIPDTGDGGGGGGCTALGDGDFDSVSYTGIKGVSGNVTIEIVKSNSTGLYLRIRIIGNPVPSFCDTMRYAFIQQVAAGWNGNPPDSVGGNIAYPSYNGKGFYAITGGYEALIPINPTNLGFSYGIIAYQGWISDCCGNKIYVRDNILFPYSEPDHYIP